jgi:hypothetical protein
MSDAIQIAIGAVQGLTLGAVFVLILFIGFCVFVGFMKTKPTAGKVLVVRSLDERMTNRSIVYLPPNAPRGPADQLKAPELVEAAARK